MTLPALFTTLPKRFSRAALIRNFPRATSMKIIDRFSLRESGAQNAEEQSRGIRQELEGIFSAKHGFSSISHIDYTDGVRVIFQNGDVAHFRPSGNADELRIYAVADTQERADQIAAEGVAEPEGLLRKLERLVQT
jgi:phosphomannomutase